MPELSIAPDPGLAVVFDGTRELELDLLFNIWTKRHLEWTDRDVSKILIVTYPGIDGCAAAALLSRHFARREREVRFQSQFSIGYAFGQLVSEASGAGLEVHVCGVGVAGAQEGPLRSALEVLAAGRGAPTVVWWCGRQYDQPVPEWLGGMPGVTLHSNGRFGTHTAFVSRRLFEERGEVERAHADRLVSLSRCDRRVRGEDAGALTWTERQRPIREAFEVLEAALTEFFKFGDAVAAPAAVESVARNSYSPGQRRRVDVFRKHGHRYKLQGRSSQMRAVKAQICKVARSSRPVSIHGETGVGKELVARLIHERSERALEPFVAVNCATLGHDVNMAYSRLFGHGKGSFTGAEADKPGLFVEGSGGTVFLDEVAELPLMVQAMLLRVLQEKVVQPLGTHEETEVDVRVIVATNESLPALVAAGRFREDLFYRLNILPIHVPPLRERPHDIPPLARHIAFSLEAEGAAPPSAFSDGELALLRGYPWPGNVRQLRNVLERAVAMEISIEESLEVEARTEEAFRVVRREPSGGAGPSAAPQGPGSAEKAVKEGIATLSDWIALDKAGALSVQLPKSAEGFVDMDSARDTFLRAYARAAYELIGTKAAAARRLGCSRTTLDKYLQDES